MCQRQQTRRRCLLSMCAATPARATGLLLACGLGQKTLLLITCDARPTSSRAEQAGGGSAAAPAGSFTSVTIHPLSTPPSGQPPGSQIAHTAGDFGHV